MQVGAVSLSNQAFKGNPYQEEILQGIANLNDNEINQLAKAKTLSDVKEKKHRRINNALFCSIPVAAGLAAAAVPTIVNPSRIGRLIEFAKGFGSWTVPLVVGAGIAKGASALNKSSDTYNNFNEKHPILSNITLILAGLAGIRGVEKLGSKLWANYGLKFADKYADKVVKFSEKLENSKILNAVSKKVKSMPKLAKGAIKSGLSFAPWVLVVAGFVNMIRHNNKKANTYIANYYDLKNTQAQVRDYLANQSEEV